MHFAQISCEHFCGTAFFIVFCHLIRKVDVASRAGNVCCAEWTLLNLGSRYSIFLVISLRSAGLELE